MLVKFTTTKAIINIVQKQDNKYYSMKYGSPLLVKALSQLSGRGPRSQSALHCILSLVATELQF